MPRSSSPNIGNQGRGDVLQEASGGILGLWNERPFMKRVTPLMAGGTEVIRAPGFGDRPAGLSHECDDPRRSVKGVHPR